jgi:hypothetical protein
MLDAQRRNGGSSAGSGLRLAGFGPRLRLFVLLGLLAPMFVGLQHIVQESVPQIEVRLIPPDAQVAGSTPSERVVERVVYVPVERTETAPMTAQAAGLPQTGLSQATGRSADQPRVRGMDSASAAPAMQASHKEPPADPATVELATDTGPVDEPLAHMGVVTVVTPVAAPPVAVAAPARFVAAPAYVVPAPVQDPVAVADADEDLGDGPADDDDVALADEPSAESAPAEPEVAEIEVVETTIGSAEPNTRVVSYKIPVRPAEPTGDAELVAAQDDEAGPEDDTAEP